MARPPREIPCDAPRAPVGPITASAAGGASSTWTRGSIFQDATGFVDCLGEDAHFFGEEPFMLHQVTSASGVTQSFFQFLPIKPNGPQFSMQGVVSGRLYQLKNGLPVNEIFQFGPDMTFSHLERDVYVNVANKADQITFVLQLHVTMNANGVVTADKSVFKVECAGI